MCAAVCFCVLNASCAIVLVLYAACVTCYEIIRPVAKGGGVRAIGRFPTPHPPVPVSFFGCFFPHFVQV